MTIRVPHDVVDLDGLLDLVKSKIELLSDYKLEYPQDYDDDDIERMKAEIDRLEAVHADLRRIRGAEPGT